MKRFLLFISLIILAVGLIACGNHSNDGNDAGGSSDSSDNETSVDVEAAEALYKDSCASCHGDDLEGDFGPALEKIGSDLSEDEIRDTIESGGEKMPAEVLKGDDADTVAAWLSTLE